MLWGIFLAVIVLVFAAVRMFTREIIEVRVAAVNHQNLLSTVSTNGKVEPIEVFQAHAPAPGVVAKVFVTVGQKVKKNDLLIKMSDSDAIARLAAANATLRSAQVITHDVDQGGSQEERLSRTGDTNKAKLQQKQASRDLVALQA